MQAALSSFSKPAWQPLPWGSCLNCHAMPHRIEAGVVYCKAADYHGLVKPERSCKHWWPEEPLDLWPPLAPNFGKALADRHILSRICARAIRDAKIPKDY